MKLFQTCGQIIVKLNEAHLTPLNVSSINTGPFRPMNPFANQLCIETQMVWCFDTLGTVQEPRDLSTGPRGKNEHGKAPQKWMHFYSTEGWFTFLNDGNFHDSMIFMVCFRDLYIFFQLKNPPDWAPNNPIFSISPPCNVEKWHGWLSWMVSYCYTN